MEYRREIAVVYTIDEVTAKLNNIRGHGFSEHEIHLFAKDIRPLHSLKMYTDLDIHQAGTMIDHIFSIFLRQSIYAVCLRHLDFSHEEVTHYSHCIEQGAIVIVAQHEFPFEKEPKKQRKALTVSNVPK